MQSKNSDAWSTFRQFTEISGNYAPYVYSLILTPVLEYNYPKLNEMVELFEKIIDNPDSLGIMKVMSYERLQGFYERMGKIRLSDSVSAKMNGIKDWVIIGPFDNISSSGFDKPYPPETEFADKTYEGKNFIPVNWLKINNFRKDNWIDFMQYYNVENSVYYANTFVYSPRKQTVYLRLGTSGSLKTYLNDQLIFNVSDEYNNDVDTYVAETSLNEGWNKLLVKCGLSDLNRCNFLARITDKSGNRLEGIRFSTEAQDYRKGEGPIRLFNNFAEDYFVNKIKEHPDYPENYVLLADCYLRNDKGIDAELVLKKAIDKFPGCALFYYSLYEAYIRGHKSDDAEIVLTKINDLDPLIPSTLIQRIKELLAKEDFEKVEKLIEDFEKNNPEPYLLATCKLCLAGEKKQTDKVIEFMNSMYNSAPYRKETAVIKAYFEYQISKDINKGIEILDSLLKYDYDKSILALKAEYYLDASQKEKWDSTYDCMISLDPSNTEYLIQKATIYNTMQNYAKAEEFLNRALEISPCNAGIWKKLGEVYLASEQKSKAIKGFEKALFYDPRAYDAREKLRELRGKKSIFSEFEKPDIESELKNAPRQTDYPGSNAVYLFVNSRNVLYGQGATEKLSEKLIKVFNKKGIDAFKEYNVNSNSLERVIFDDAYVIKADGSKVNADIKGTKLYFKSLEENDFIYIKYRTRDYYEGNLSSHFWDSFPFNGFYPVKKIQYSLLAFNEIKFNYKTKNFKLEPEIMKSEEGKIYQWTLENEPGIIAESGMPPLKDICKQLLISTIPDWGYLVKWYADIAKNKRQSSYEIKEQVNRILKSDSLLTDDQKIERIFNYITQNIRYSSLSFRQSGLIPQKARDVLINKIGDCKDVATLFISMLAETGIKANYVLVNTKSEGLNEDILPSLEFNHCIAAIGSGDTKRYFDLTADNFDYKTLPPMDQNAFSLFIREGNENPEYINTETNMAAVSREHQVIIRNDNSLIDSVCTVKSGYYSAEHRYSYRYLDKEGQTKKIMTSINEDYPTAKMVSFDPGKTDEITSESKYYFTIEIPSYLTEAAGFKFFRLPWMDLIHPTTAISYDKRIYPINFPFSDLTTEKIYIRLPENYVPAENVYESNLKCKAGEYSNRYEYKNGMLIAERRILLKKTKVMPEDYSEFKEFWNNMLKEETRQILLKENK
jgi:tetratricopeptide (TPR) repeat protein